MEAVLLHLLKMLLAGGLGFSIGMLVAPYIKKEVEKTFGPAEAPSKNFSKN